MKNSMQGKVCWLIMGAINLLIVFISAMVIYCNRQSDVEVVFVQQDSESKLYSVSEMREGVYEVTIYYDATGQYELSFHPIRNIYADKYRMPAEKNKISCRIWVNGDMDCMYLSFEAGKPELELDIKNIIFQRSFRETFTYRMLKIFVVLIMADVAFIGHWKWDRIRQWLKDNTYIALGLLMIFGVSSFASFMNCETTGHDIYFHLARIVGLAEGLSTGQMPIKIQPGWANDYGYAVSVFYGDVFMYVPAVLYLLGVPLLFTYNIYLIMIHVGTISISYWCYRKLCGDGYIGLLCTALTCLSINRILNVYTRAALGEYSAYMFFPLVIVGMKEILCRNKRDYSDEGKRNGWILLGLGMAGIVQTHILSFEMVCILLGITVILRMKSMLHPDRICEMVKSAALAIGLSAWFLVPFLDYSGQDLSIFQEVAEYNIQGFGINLYELFSLPTKAAGLANLSEEGLEGRFPISLGLGITLLIMIGVVALVRIDWDKEERRHMLFVSGLAGVCTWMATIYFPWNRLAMISCIRNVVYSFQFQWRFLSPAIPLLAYASGLVLVRVKGSISWGRMKYLLLCLFMVTIIQGMYVTDLAVRDSRRGIYDGGEVLRADYVLMGGEYLFNDTSLELTREDSEVSGQNVKIADVCRKGNEISVTCSASTDAYMEFPLWNYKYYKCVDVRENTDFLVNDGENHKIRVDLPEGYQGTLHVFFEEPWYWRAAEAVSLFTLLSVCAYGINIIVKRRKNHKLTD